MRKLAFASAALAALVLTAGAASAQSVQVNGYIHNASGSPQTANFNLSSTGIGSTLIGRGVAIGTSLSVESLDNIDAGTSRLSMLNTSGQTANVNITNVGVGGAAEFTATAGANAATFDADDNLSLGVVVQSNNVAQRANLNVASTGVTGNVSGGATAFGNSISGNAEFGSIVVSQRAERQSNVGTQIANVNVGQSGFGADVTLQSLAAGNVQEYDAAGAGFYTVNQANGRDANFFGLVGYDGSSQTANLNFTNSGVTGAGNLSAAAVGNIATLTGGGNITAVLDLQSHNSAQVSNLNISNSGFGSLTGVAQSIGTSATISTRP